jgi:hypothetical protein
VATERIRLRVSLRDDSSPARFIAAVKEYAREKDGRPWSIASLVPFRLRHASPRAEGVTYTISRETDGSVNMLVAGRRARLGLAYAITLLTNARFGDHVANVGIDLQPVG